MLSMRKTAEQRIYLKTAEDEYHKFVDSMKGETALKTEKGTNAFPSFPMNRLVYSLTYNEKIKNLSYEYHNETENDVFMYVELNYKNGKGLRSYIDVAKIGNHDFTFREAMAIIRQMREAVGPEVFYGAVIANKYHVDVNPLHPLVLNEFMRMSDEELERNRLNGYSVIIYTFTDTWKGFREANPLKVEVKERYTQDILDLVLGTKFKREVFVKAKHFKLEEHDNKKWISYDEQSVDAEGNILDINTEDANNKYKQSYIIPGQILNLSGITYPYYGAIYVKGGRAWNLSPMWATNIDNPNGKTKPHINGSNICTKVGDARTANGCKTLNHSNTTSQRNPKTFTDGAMGYAQVAVDVALAMFYNDYDGTVQLAPGDKRMTFAEYKKVNTKATRREYMDYIKNLMKERMT